MSYTTSGFNEFLIRQPSGAIVGWSEDEVATRLSQVSGSLIGGGVSQSADGKIIINWDTGEATFSDGARGRVFLGKIPGTNDYGIKIVDALGNVVMSSSSLLQTAGIEDGAVTSGKVTVSQLDALAVNTGALTVDESITAGGSANGIIYVKDSSNNTKVQLDQDGIAINSGKMVIKNDAETTMIDARGLVSTANFASGSGTKTADQTISSTTYADVSSMTVTFTASSTRTTKVLFLCTLSYETPEWDSVIIFQFLLDGTTPIGPLFVGGSTFDESTNKTVSTHFIYSLPSGEHTVKLQAKMNNVGESGYIRTGFGTNGILTYIVLGN